MQQTIFSGNKLHWEMPAFRISFDGVLSADGNEIKGTFTQGAAMPLTLKPVDQVSTFSRPQTPKAPFPYESVDVGYENKAGGVKLAGTLTLPRTGGPFPVAIMITGSGPEDRDETILGHSHSW